jgi:transcriptional regulator with XRE-family HTH domain
MICGGAKMEKPINIKRFGDFIREARMAREITLKQMAEYLGMSLSLLSDIENHRRNPFDREKLEIFAQRLNLSVAEISEMYDLAGRESNRIPIDIEDIMMYTPEGDIARLALRKTKSGELTIEDWKRLIREKESERE